MVFDELINIFEYLVEGKIYDFFVLDLPVLFFRLEMDDSSVGDFGLNYILVHLGM